MDTKNNAHLQYLDDLSDYKVASEDPDVRGWKVKDAEDRTIGKVESFLVNKEAKRVRYLDVEVDDSIIEAGHKATNKVSNQNVHEYINEDGENHLIVPIGLAVLDKDNKYVKVNDVDYNTFAKTKRIGKRKPIQQDYELLVMRTYRGEDQFPEGTKVDDKFYDRKEFDNKTRF